MKLSGFIANFIVFTLLFLSADSFSQTANKPPDRMKMLAAFNGEWNGEMVQTSGNKTVKYKLSHTSEKIAGGWGIKLSETAIIPEKGKYQAAKIFSYSATGDTTYMYTVDNFGETWFYTGIWVTNKKLILKSTMELNGKPTEKEAIYQFINPKRYEYKSIIRVQGAADELVEMTMIRD